MSNSPMGRHQHRFKAPGHLRAWQLALRSDRNTPNFFQAGGKQKKKSDPPQEGDTSSPKKDAKQLKSRRGRPRKNAPRSDETTEKELERVAVTLPAVSASSSSSSLSKPAAKKPKPDLMVIEDGDDIPLEEEPLFGHVVWAQFGSYHSYHPAIVIKGSQVNLATPDGTQAFVFWFSDRKVSAVARDKLLEFVPFFQDRAGQCGGKKGQHGLVSAIVEVSRQAELGGHGLLDIDLLVWAQTGFPTRDRAEHQAFTPSQDFTFPESILERLLAIGAEIRRKAKDKDRDIPNEFHDESAIKAVWQGTRQLSEVCVGCADCDRKLVCQHPVFEGGLCSKCKESLQETFYAVGDDGTHSYCMVCGSGGQLFVCDTPTCGRVFCVPCVEELGGEDVLRKVEEARAWPCFLCRPFKVNTHGLLKPHPDWRQKLVLFFDMGHSTSVVPDLEYFKSRRPIRVLSLFDGIGTGLLALKNAGFKVEVYYASETDEQATVIAQVNHGNQINQMGDVTKITTQMLAELAPFDLLIGGSPCNELSLANPQRKGFDVEGSGVLFFDFYRVLRDVTQLNGSTHLFWMYENVASMRHVFRAVISRFLQRQPAVWDAKHLSAQKRARFFWGNIPGLYSTPDLSDSLRHRVDLNSVLAPHCDRRATVQRVRTVTTQPNSLLQGPGQNMAPVTMAGCHDTLWLSELERLFGFPAHYTDVGNLSPTKRRALLGRSWSVQVVTEILRPLTQYFATNDMDTGTDGMNTASVTADLNTSSVATDMYTASISGDMNTASVTADLSEASVTANKNPANVTADKNPVNVTAETASVTADLNTGSVTDGMDSDSVTADMEPVSVTADLNTATVTADMNTVSVTADMNTASVTADMNTASVTVDTARVTADMNTASMTTDLNTAKVTTDMNTASVTTNMNTASVTADLNTASITADTTSVSDKMNTATVTADKNTGNVTDDMDTASVTANMTPASVTTDTSRATDGMDSASVTTNMKTPSVGADLNTVCVTVDRDTASVTANMNTANVTADIDSDSVAAGVASVTVDTVSVTSKKNTVIVTADMDKDIGFVNVSSASGLSDGHLIVSIDPGSVSGIPKPRSSVTTSEDALSFGNTSDSNETNICMEHEEDEFLPVGLQLTHVETCRSGNVLHGTINKPASLEISDGSKEKNSSTELDRPDDKLKSVCAEDMTTTQRKTHSSRAFPIEETSPLEQEEGSSQGSKQNVSIFTRQEGRIDKSLSVTSVDSSPTADEYKTVMTSTCQSKDHESDPLHPNVSPRTYPAEKHRTGTPVQDQERATSCESNTDGEHSTGVLELHESDPLHSNLTPRTYPADKHRTGTSVQERATSRESHAEGQHSTGVLVLQDGYLVLRKTADRKRKRGREPAQKEGDRGTKACPGSATYDRVELASQEANKDVCSQHLSSCLIRGHCASDDHDFVHLGTNEKDHPNDRGKASPCDVHLGTNEKDNLNDRGTASLCDVHLGINEKDNLNDRGTASLCDDANLTSNQTNLRREESTSGDVQVQGDNQQANSKRRSGRKRGSQTDAVLDIDETVMPPCKRVLRSRSQKEPGNAAGISKENAERAADCQTNTAKPKLHNRAAHKNVDWKTSGQTVSEQGAEQQTNITEQTSLKKTAYENVSEETSVQTISGRKAEQPAISTRLKSQVSKNDTGQTSVQAISCQETKQQTNTTRLKSSKRELHKKDADKNTSVQVISGQEADQQSNSIGKKSQESKKDTRKTSVRTSYGRPLALVTPSPIPHRKKVGYCQEDVQADRMPAADPACSSPTRRSDGIRQRWAAELSPHNNGPSKGGSSRRCRLRQRLAINTVQPDGTSTNSLVSLKQRSAPKIEQPDGICTHSLVSSRQRSAPKKFQPDGIFTGYPIRTQGTRIKAQTSSSAFLTKIRQVDKRPQYCPQEEPSGSTRECSIHLPHLALENSRTHTKPVADLTTTTVGRTSTGRTSKRTMVTRPRKSAEQNAALNELHKRKRKACGLDIHQC